jgi:prepilin-type N-terminal cleavage/methylation domain-containing protein
MSHRRSRSGFTLIEMLLVLAIVVILAAILIPISLRLTDNNQVAHGASQLQGALAQSKTRATGTRRSNGVRLIPMDFDRLRRNPALTALPNAANPGAAINANYMSWYDKFEFVEDPGDYTDGWVWAMVAPPVVPTDPTPPIPTPAQRNVGQPNFGPGVNNPIPGLIPQSLVTRTYNYIPTPLGYNPRVNPAPFPFQYRLFGPLDGLVAARTPVGRRGFNFVNNILAGDRLELYGNGQVYEIIAVLGPVGNLPSSVIVDRPLPYDIPVPPTGKPNYRIIRQPRAVPTLKPVYLPAEVVIELINPFRNPINKTYPLNPAVDHDIPALQESGAQAGFPDLNARDPSNQIWMRGVSNIKAVPGTPIDIMFSPAGQVVNLPQGIIHLWLHRASNPAAWFARNASAADYRPENQALVTIYSRTGTITSYRVNQSITPPVNAANVRNWPWLDALTGNAQGLGGI